MAPKYRLSYFPMKGLGEPIRLLLSYGNIEFEDRRINEKDWLKFKQSTPLEQMPVLEIGDKVYHQSIAISRFLGKQFGLAGKTEEEDLEIDIAVDVFNDFAQNVASAHYEEDDVVKEKKLKIVSEETIPRFVKKLNEMATINKGHLALGRFTWADFFYAGIIDYVNSVSPLDILANYSNLKAVRDNVLALPAVIAWYAKAPEPEE